MLGAAHTAKLGLLDGGIVLGYLVFVFVIGVWMGRRASLNIESYFLGNRSIPWWLLGASGSSSFFDITGTMWMVSVFFVLGMRGLWVHCFWAFPLAGIVMAYKAKWAYRSGVLTGMEWLVFRYGHGPAGQAVRLVSVLVGIVAMVLMLGYAGTGVGKFLEEFLPLTKAQIVPLLFAFTGLYVLLGGFFSVVYSDLFQTVLLSFAAVYIAVAAFLQIDPEHFRQMVGADWFDLRPLWQLADAPVEYAEPFGLLIMLWVGKGLFAMFGSAGGVEFQRFCAARSDAEASKVGLAWGVVISIRWALVMGITAFGLMHWAGHPDAADAERVLPMVLNTVLPVGVKGLVIAGLMAAFMSTFDSTVNVASSYVVNDLVKPVWKHASPRALVVVGYLTTFVVVAAGILISLRTQHIRDIWNPINFAVGAAMIAPSLLALYWWRLGGWAHCCSIVCTAPIAVYVYQQGWTELQYFPLLTAVSLASCIVAAFIFKPAPRATLIEYYARVRPFGVWAPARQMVEAQGGDVSCRPCDRYDLPVAIVATVFFIFLYVLMMDLVVHNWLRVAWGGPICAASAVALYVLWWRRLPSSDIVSPLVSGGADTVDRADSATV
ncbi:MAG: hypothetical protein JXA69_12220 [Phycisphaerae bacterium]|nr:hypothetical protein [Phycisphaerae bacterium]